MATGAIRGSRVGSSQTLESDHGDIAPRREVSYYCVNSHVVTLPFASEAEEPDTWDCPKCGLPASVDAKAAQGLEAPRTEVYKTHLAYAKERRSDAEAESILTEALNALRSQRRGR